MRPVSSAAISVDPEPRNGSYTQAAPLRVVQQGTAHQFHRLLCSVPGDGVGRFLSPKRIEVRALPHGRLLAVPAPRSRLADSHRVPARLVLPVIMAPAQSKMLFHPDDL